MKDNAMPIAGSALSEHLANYAASFDARRIPDEVRERARLLMLDSIGIAIASHSYDFSDRALAAIGELDGGGDSVVIGCSRRMDLRNAALANGTLIHGLDYDDTHARGVIHATASALPTALALAARQDRSGADMVAAYVLGMEVSTRLGAVAKGGFHQIGFHPTGLIGAFGCTLAAGWLLGLNARQMVDAQGIALSLASGSLEFLNDGAWNKRIHPGWAASAGITAATFGKHGYTGTRLAYEGRFGLYASHLGTGDYDLSLATAELGDRWELMRVSVKPLPACHFTHASVDAAARLHAQGVQVDQVHRITVLVPQEVVKTVCEPESSKRRPANSYEAQFSIPYLVGTALCKGRLTLDDLEPAALQDPAVLALAAVTDYRHDPDSGFPRHYSGEVVVELKDGRVVREREAVNRGAEDRPLTESDIRAKYRDNVLRRTSAECADAIEHSVLRLEQGSSRALADQLGRDI